MRYPILYKSTETEFENNGIGILSDCIKCTISEALNGALEMQMQYPISGIHYNSIARRSIIKCKVNAISDPQLFRVYSANRTMSGIATIFAEHISYDLSGIPVSVFTANNAPNALIGLKDNAVSDCPFTFWTDKSNYGAFAVTEPGSIRSQLGGKGGSIISVYGGEWEFDNFQVKLHNRRGMDRGVTIRYGKNLTNLEQDENCSSCYTAVYPYWISTDGNLVQLPEKIINAPGTYDYERIMTLNLSQDFEEAPTEDELRQRTAKYISDNEIGVPKISWKISYLDLEKSEEYKGKALLERVLLGDTVSVEFASMGVSAKARVVAIEYDALLDRNTSITLGSIKADITDTIAEQKKQTENMVTPSLVQSIATTLTSAILGAKGGSVRLLDENNDGMPDTLYIADNPDPAQAVNVWRYNYAGWAGSKNGYNGPFTLGATLDDGILAEAVTAANLTAGTIRNKDGTFYVNLDTKEVNIKAIDSAVNNLQIGGRNLYLHSLDYYNGSGYWKGLGNWETDSVTYNGLVVKKRYQAWSGFAPYIEPRKGDIYTLSFYARGDLGTDLMDVSRNVVPRDSVSGLRTIGGNYAKYSSEYVKGWWTAGQDATAWKRYWATLEITEENVVLQWRVEKTEITEGKYVYVCGFKLEKGNKPTDWTPAPEDMASQEQVASLEITVGGISGRVSNVEQTASSTSTKVASLETTVDGISGRVSAVEETANSTSKQVADLELDVAGISASVSQTQADLDGLQIGGRNLLYDTRAMTVGRSSEATARVYTIFGNMVGTGGGLDRTTDGIKLTFGESSATSIQAPLANFGSVANNEVVTLSFEYRGNIPEFGGWYFLQQTSPSVSLGGFPSLNPDGAWHKYTHTFSSSQANARTCVSVLMFYGHPSYDSTKWVEIKEGTLKLEKGNKATDWTPAPEDMASQEQVASLKLTVDRITGRVATVEETAGKTSESVNTLTQKANSLTIDIQRITDDGVSKVKTGKQYTFDDEGLKITGEGNEGVENRINETGMYVDRSGTSMLQANQNGVMTTDLTARNFLKIGHSRFEAFGAGATACFWIPVASGQNILLDSGRTITNSSYIVAEYNLSTPMVEGEIYTVSLDVTPGAGVKEFAVYVSQGTSRPCTLEISGTGNQILRGTFEAKYADGKAPSDDQANEKIQIYRLPTSGAIQSTIHRCKLEIGDAPTEWSAAPEDMEG